MGRSSLCTRNRQPQTPCQLLKTVTLGCLRDCPKPTVHNSEKLLGKQTQRAASLSKACPPETSREGPSKSRASSSLELVGCAKGNHSQNPLRLVSSSPPRLGLEPSSGSKLSSPRAPVLVLPLRGHCPSLSLVPVLRTIECIFWLFVLGRSINWSLLFHRE